MSILGIDFGSRRAGIAVSDELNLMAHPVGVFDVGKREMFLNRLERVIEERKVLEIVVGMPVHLNGTVGAKAQEAVEFAEWIRGRFSMPVHLWDERLTTLEGTKLLLSQDRSRRQRRKIIDSVAAQILLQGYLDKNRHVPNQ